MKTFVFLNDPYADWEIGATGYLAKLGMLNQVAHTSNSVGFLLERALDYKGQEHY